MAKLVRGFWADASSSPLGSAGPRYGFLVLLLALALLDCGQAAPRASSKPTAVSVFAVYPDRTRQTVSQIGSGHFNHRFGHSTTATEAVSQQNIAVFRPRFARVAMDLGNWEPVNDNTDPQQIEPSGFLDDAYNRATFEFMQQLQADGVEFVASVFYVPDWMVENPRDDSQRIIAPTMYPETIESIAAWLVHAKESYGVDVKYCSFNEPNLGFYQLLSSDDYIHMLRLAGPRFAELGLKTQWLLGDCYQIGGCVAYSRPIWDAEGVRAYLGPLAFHNYDGDTNTDETLTELGNWAAERGLETRATEAGWDGELWRRPEIFPRWENAHQLMKSYNRTLKMTRATTFYYHQMVGDDYPLNDGSQSYPAMDLLRDLNEAFPPGSQVVDSSPNVNGIDLVAAHTPHGGFSVHLVNEALSNPGVSEEVQINGLPEGAYQLHLSEEDDLEQTFQPIATRGGTLSIALPTSSVGYLTKAL